MKNKIILLVLIFLLAAFLRFYGIGEESIWIDEAFAIQSSSNDSVSSVIDWVKEFDPIPPLYYIGLHFWIKVLGNSEVVVRSLSAIFNLLTLPVFFLFVKKLFNRKAAIISAFLFATSMLQVQYSQEARSYAMFSFLVWLSCLLFLKIVIDKKNHFIPYTIVSILAVYTTQLMLGVLFLQTFIYALLTNREKIKKILAAQALVVLAFIPWLPIFFRQILLINQLFQRNFIDRLHLPYAIGILGGLWFVFAFIIILGVFLFIYFKKNHWIKKLANEKLFLALVAVLLAGYVIIIPYLIKSFFLIRYFFFALPLAYLFIALGIKLVKSNKIRVFVIAAFILLNVFALSTYYSETTKPEWTQAITFIDENAIDGEVVVFDTGYSRIIYEYYGGKLPAYGLIKRNADVEDNKEYIMHIIPELMQQNDVWLVLYRNFVTEDLFKDELEKEFTLSESKDFFEIKVYHFTALS